MRWCVLAAVQVSLCVALTSTEWPDTQCLDTVAKRLNLNVKVQFHDWASHNSVRWALAILLKEGLGYDIEFVDTNSEPSYKLYEQAATGAIDVDPEVWGFSKREQYQQWVVVDGRAVDVGNLGATAAEKLFLPTSHVEQNQARALEFYKSYLIPDNIRFTINSTTHENGAPLECSDASNTFAFECPQNSTAINGSYSCSAQNGYAAWECQKGIWYTDTCCNATATPSCAQSANLSSCFEVWYPTPGWTTGIFEQTLQNLNLPASFVYFGSQETYQAQVQESILRGEPTTFYWFYPDPWLEKLGQITELIFPSWSAACYTSVQSNPQGTIDCDTPIDFLSKVVNFELEGRAPSAVHAIKMFAVKSEDYEWMFSRINNGSSVYEASCAWLREKQSDSDTWNLWVQPASFLHVKITDTTSLVLLVLCGLAILTNVVAFGFLFTKRDTRTVRNTGFGFFSVQLLGFTISEASSVAFLTTPTDLTCGLRYWLLSLGFVVAYSTLLERTRRIKRIFINSSLERRVITNSQVWMRSSTYIVGELIVLVLWQIFSPRVSKNVIDADWKKVHVSCEMSGYFVFELFLILYPLCMALACVYLAIKIFNVASEFNESSAIGMTIYSIFVCTTVAISLPFLLGTDKLELTTTLTAGLVLLGSWVASAIQIGQKAIQIHRAQSDNFNISHSRANSLRHSKPIISGNEHEQAKQILELQKLLKDKDEQIANLTSQLRPEPEIHTATAAES